MSRGIDGSRLLQLIAEDGRPLALQLGLAGVTRSNFYRIKEKGYSCSTELLCRFADFYGVSTDYLLGRTDDMGPF